MSDAKLPTTDKRHHVAVVGGGFAGIQCIKSLKRANVRITLIDQRNHHLFQPLLYQVATTILAPSDIAWPLRQIFRDRKDVTTILASVVGIDSKTQQVLLDDDTSIGYDTLVLATGATHSYFDHPEWEEHSPGLKTLEDATAIRRSILDAFESAERTDDLDLTRASLTFAIIGAGPTGVELAGIIAELAHRVLPPEFRRVDTRSARIILIEAGTKVLPSFPPTLSEYAAGALSNLGIEIMLGHPVTSCNEGSIVVGDKTILCKTIIWAAGVKASSAAKWIDVAQDRAGRAIVLPDLTAPGHPTIFVIGDTAVMSDTKGNSIPGIAPAAKQMGNYVGQVIHNRLQGTSTTAPFEYRHAGSLATVGRRAAIADFGHVKLRGSVAWWTWGIAHIYFLIGTRSRVAVTLSWIWSFLTGQNQARIITQQVLKKSKPLQDPPN